jgi:selenocysteine lyase/cysteine desulfurase
MAWFMPLSWHEKVRGVSIIRLARRRARILELKRYLRDRLEGDRRFAVKTPAADDLSAGITTVEVVGREVREAAAVLAERHHVDCRPMTNHGLNGLRISLSVFNTEDQVEVLSSGLRELAGPAV